MNKPSLVLAEDHTMIAQGIGKLLEQEYEIVSIVPDGRSLLEAVKKNQPDLVVADLSLPLLNGLEATRQIKKLFPSVRVVILTMHTDYRLVKDALAVGASAYVIKESAASELLSALKEVRRDQTYVSPVVAQSIDPENLTAGQDEPQSRPAIPLTQRQREILQLIAEGRSNKEIASILHLAIKTVEFHKTRIMRTLGSKSIPELTKYAIAHRIVTP